MRDRFKLVANVHRRGLRGPVPRRAEPSRALRIDPTRTVTLRRSFSSILRRMFARLKLELVRMVLDRDALGLAERRPMTFNAFCPTGEGGGIDNTCPPSSGGGGSGSTRVVSGVRFKSGAAAEKALAQSASQWSDEDLSDYFANKYVKRYAGTSDSFRINDCLRRKCDDKGVAETIEGLSKTLDKSSFPQDVKVFRSINVKTPEERDRILAALKEGTEFTDPAFVSTTANEKYADSWAKKMKSASPIRVTVDVPKGAKAAYLPKTHVKTQEWEVLIQKGSRFRVKSVSGNNVEMELVSGPTSNSMLTNVEDEPVEEKDEPLPEVPVRLVSRFGWDWEEIEPAVTVNSLTANAPEPGEWRFRADPEKLRLFQEWLRKQLKQHVTGKQQEELWRAFVEQGFRKGSARSYDDTMASERFRESLAETGPRLDFYAKSRMDFLRSAFRQPVAVEKVKLIASRAYDDLENVTSDMAARMRRALADGMARGAGPREVARELADVVDLGQARAQVIARTEVIRAHAEGQLVALDQLGVEEVGVAVEWSTARDERVCELCKPMEGVVLKLSEAQGLIPRHPNCRCAFIPANVGESKRGQTRTAPGVREAIRTSKELGQESEGWKWAPNKRIAGERPQSILNAVAEFDRLVNGGE